MKFIGLGKTLFNSSACMIEENDGRLDIELVLSERIVRQKATGVWPENAIEVLHKKRSLVDCSVAEHHDIALARQAEDYLNQCFPFYEHLKSQKLERFTSRFNPNIKTIPRHLCHAYAGVLISPFEKALIVVWDKAGASLGDLPTDHPERKNHLPYDYDPFLRYLEECSVYTLEMGKLSCIKKKWQIVDSPDKESNQRFSDGLGALYHKAAEYIFNDTHATSKLMDLAPLGKAFAFSDRHKFLRQLEWTLSFKGTSNIEWESGAHIPIFANIAASVQAHFENEFLSLVRELHEQLPQYKNIILMGSCSMNCATNMKILESNFFESVFIPPFPGDESISLGAASYLYHTQRIQDWKPWSLENQIGYFGPSCSVPTENEILNAFCDFNIEKPESIEKFAAKKIANNKIIGWFQDRSESGPRALGNRSLLSRVDRPSIKDFLNSTIKNREYFNSYGCSITQQDVHRFFEVKQNFENPFMSFSARVQKNYLDLFREVTRTDGTSQVQTVRLNQNKKFYNLLQEVGKLTNLPCVLNTSLSSANEPAVESIEDAKRFLQISPVDGLVVQDFFITKKI